MKILNSIVNLPSDNSGHAFHVLAEKCAIEGKINYLKMVVLAFFSNINHSNNYTGKMIFYRIISEFPKNSSSELNYVKNFDNRYLSDSEKIIKYTLMDAHGQIGIILSNVADQNNPNLNNHDILIIENKDKNNKSGLDDIFSQINIVLKTAELKLQ